MRFYTALRKNNNRAWFEANRATYDAHVMAPAKLFVTAMGERLKKIAPRHRRHPRGQQVHLPHQPRHPLQPGPDALQDEPGHLLLGRDPAEDGIVGILLPARAARPLSRRRHVHDPRQPPRPLPEGRRRPEERRGDRARSSPRSGRGEGFSVEGEHYKRVPAGFDPGHPNAELLKHKGLYASFETKVPEEFYSARLVDYCFERFEPIVPLHRWLMKLFGLSAARAGETRKGPCARR